MFRETFLTSLSSILSGEGDRPLAADPLAVRRLERACLNARIAKETSGLSGVLGRFPSPRLREFPPVGKDNHITSARGCQEEVKKILEFFFPARCTPCLAKAIPSKLGLSPAHLPPRLFGGRAARLGIDGRLPPTSTPPSSELTPMSTPDSNLPSQPPHIERVSKRPSDRARRAESATVPRQTVCRSILRTDGTAPQYLGLAWPSGLATAHSSRPPGRLSCD